MIKSLTTALEISDSHLKCIQMKEVRQKKMISSCQIKALPDNKDETLARLLRELTVSKNIRPDQMVLILPRRSLILKNIRLPSQDERELKKMTGLQLVNKIPYNLEDIVYDYHVIRKDASGYSELLIVIVHKEICQKYIDILDKIGLRIGKITLSSLGILGWVNYQESQKLLDTNTPLMLINIDVGNSEICFFHGQRLIFSRSINYGTKDIQSESATELLQQIDLSSEVYRKENLGSEIKQLALVSLVGDLGVLGKTLEGHCKVPVRIFSSLENMLCQKNINLSALKEQPGGSVTASLGVLLADQRNLVNLTPQEVHATQLTRVRKRQWITFAILLFVTISLACSIGGMEWFRKMKYLDEFEAKVKVSKAKVQKAKEKIEFINAFHDKLNQRVLMVDLLDELFKLTPSEISFRSLDIDNRGMFVMEGYAQTRTGVNDFQSRLVKSPRFHNVNLEFATKRKIFKTEVTDFKITAQLIQGTEKE